MCKDFIRENDRVSEWNGAGARKKMEEPFDQKANLILSEKESRESWVEVS